ncbi:hypothetical protein AQI88_40790 [Streptomyces cellostaticus]|uniref:Uncharacterized protein n=1 Tax=Streptomyces cellostaticus TaxID=67285 RepID=A0A101N6K7_9ACTN|nr:hypothetical protein [Streptomyces cellostaticus]KUM87508.1 hypothetical protein AQI88_40790 [Streptomyces cellostaticus]GHI04583.1 hypothetical protein Scel_29040 [Streptomyces cellostaticus]
MTSRVFAGLPLRNPLDSDRSKNTVSRHGGLAWVVTLSLGAFIGLLVLPIVLVTPAWQNEWGATVAVAALGACSTATVRLVYCHRR